MKKITTLLLGILFLFTTTIFAQQGINYKALITDNGIAMANQSVTIQFTILQNATTNVYQEEHTTTTDANGIAIANIGEGTQISGIFNDVDWRNEQFLKVEINTGSGFEDFGTTAFKAVPHAKSAEKLLPTDKVIIGDTDTYATEKLYVKNANPDSELVDFRVGDLTAGKDVLNLYIDQNTSGSGLNNRSQFIEATRGSLLKFKVDDDGRVFSQKGFYTNGYVVGTTAVESYGNIKAWGNLEVDGEVTSDLKMGDNKIRATKSGNADMKAFMYGTFTLGCNMTVDQELYSGNATDGFTVKYNSVGRYQVVFDTYLGNQIDDLTVVVTPNSRYATYQGNQLSVPTVFVVNKFEGSSRELLLRQYDLNGNLSDAGASFCGHNPSFEILIFKK